MKQNITNEQCKDTGLAMVLILLITVLVSKNTSFITPAIFVLVLTMTSPKLFRPLAKLWFGLSNLMGEVVSRVLLTIVFFLVVTPVGLLRKGSGKDAMGTKNWKAGEDTAFIERNHQFSAADLEKPF